MERSTRYFMRQTYNAYCRHKDRDVCAQLKAIIFLFCSAHSLRKWRERLMWSGGPMT